MLKAYQPEATLPYSLPLLAQRAFDAYEHAVLTAAEVVVQPAMPILYFGDEPAYRRSDVKVVTVGLNPSLAEHPALDPFVRFRGAESGQLDAGYFPALNAYFRQAPYRRWFDTFNGLLHGLDASFDADRSNVALHTDLGTPVPTNPTWSKLPRGVDLQLGAQGTPLWHDLIEQLKPDLILASVARNWMTQIRFETMGPWRDLRVFAENRTRPYVVRGRRLCLAGGYTSLLVWGQASQTPFGSLSYQHKHLAGTTIKESLDAL